jgi:hypothetical protein
MNSKGNFNEVYKAYKVGKIYVVYKVVYQIKKNFKYLNDDNC